MCIRDSFTTNVPDNSLFGIFTSQLYRMYRANSTLEGFYESVNVLIQKLNKQGFSKNTLFHKLQKFIAVNFLGITFKYWEVIDLSLF